MKVRNVYSVCSAAPEEPQCMRDSFGSRLPFPYSGEIEPVLELQMICYTKPVVYT
jgi:hypothetical protein